MKYLAFIPFLFCTMLHAQPRTVEISTYALWGASAATDVALSQMCIQNGRCQEANPMMTSSEWMPVAEAGMTGLSMYVFHRLRRSHPKIRWMIPSIQIVAHGVGIWSASRYQ